MFEMPGDPDDLRITIDMAEESYELNMRFAPIVVYWDIELDDYDYEIYSLYKPFNTIEVVRIPK